MDASAGRPDPLLQRNAARHVRPPVASTSVAVTITLAGLTLYAASGPPSPALASPTMLAAFGWLLLGLLYIRDNFAAAVARLRWGRPGGRRLSPRNRDWPIIPIVLLLTTVACGVGLPAVVKFRLSRPALEQAARTALARGPHALDPPVRVGLYGDCEVAAHGRAAYFSLPTLGTGTSDGFVYSPAGPPGGWHTCRPMGGPWYQWDDKFGTQGAEGP